MRMSDYSSCTWSPNRAPELRGGSSSSPYSAPRPRSSPAGYSRECQWGEPGPWSVGRSSLVGADSVSALRPSIQSQRCHGREPGKRRKQNVVKPANRG